MTRDRSWRPAAAYRRDEASWAVLWWVAVTAVAAATQVLGGRLL